MAGLTKRCLLGVHSSLTQDNPVWAEIVEPFGGRADPFDPNEPPEESISKKDIPTYCHLDNLPPNLILMDTPDFDVGDKRGYANRGVAEHFLTACDILVYICTGATFNSKGATDFVRDVLTGVGQRKSVLVYRVFPGISDMEVQQHMVTLAQNLYGDQWDTYVLGVYRVHESNDVVVGSRLMDLLPVGDTNENIMDLLAAQDPRATKREVQESMLNDILDDAKTYLDELDLSWKELRLYGSAVELVQRDYVAAAVSDFPANDMYQELLKIYERVAAEEVAWWKPKKVWLSAKTRYRAFRDAAKQAQASSNLRIKGEDIIRKFRTILIKQTLSCTAVLGDQVGHATVELAKEIVAEGDRLGKDVNLPSFDGMSGQAAPLAIPRDQQLTLESPKCGRTKPWKQRKYLRGGRGCGTRNETDL